MILVRYADDIIVGFESETDARRFWEDMRKRFDEFSLSLHPEKTRLIEFGCHAADRRQKSGLGKPETFNFLGFTHICARSRKGQFLLKRKSRRDRVRAKLKEIGQELRRRMHQPVPEQGRWLGQVVRGYFAYHAVPTNSTALGDFRHHVTELWRRTLQRRSQKDGCTWVGSNGWPTLGFRARESFTHGRTDASPSNTQGGSRMREFRSYGSVRGGAQ